MNEFDRGAIMPSFLVLPACRHLHYVIHRFEIAQDIASEIGLANTAVGKIVDTHSKVRLPGLVAISREQMIVFYTSIKRVENKAGLRMHRGPQQRRIIECKTYIGRLVGN